MAIFHFSAKVISRSSGRSAIASAAYRAAECLHDHRLDCAHDYTAKTGVVHSEILLPTGAPARWANRETLWNEVEAGEKRKDAQLARDIEIALPRELEKAEAIRLVQDFVREQFVARGMVADLNVHWGVSADGGEQPHAHVMLSMRRLEPVQTAGKGRGHGGEANRERHPRRGAGGAPGVTEDPGLDGGAGQRGRSDRADPAVAASDPQRPAHDADPAGDHRAASRLARVMAAGRLRGGIRRQAPDVRQVLQVGRSVEMGFGPKETAWNDRALLAGWRERWAEMANARLLELGHDQRIDHRSHVAQGIALEPQNKIGPAGARREARGEDAERAAEHRALARRNGERLLAEPALALRALTHQQSTFTRADLARLVHRQSDGAAQFAAVMAKVEASPELVRVGADGRGRARFSTREMVAAERQLATTAAALSRRTTHRVASERRTAAVADRRLSEEQQLAYLHVTRSRDLAVVVGIAGGGKSTMLGVARQAWEGQGYRVWGAALSGIAAEGLEGSAGIESRTIASWEHAWRRGKEALGARDVLVLDEAGMVGSKQLGRLMEAVHAAGAKLVLVGDAEQLQAIEAGAAFRAVAERVGVVAITEPRRQVPEWQRMATKELSSARTAVALDRYQGAGMVHRHATREAARAGVIAEWDAARRAAPASSQIIFAHERADVRALNDVARAVRRAAGELGADQLLATEAGVRAFAKGDRVYFLRNERRLGVKNGTLGTLERIEGERLSVRLDGADAAGTGRAVSFSLSEYADLDHGYAATVHKNQGTTVDQAHVLATPGMDRHLAYVALSRHRHAVQLHWGEDDFGSPEELRVALGRERAKDTTLDYGLPEMEPVAAYAERRGLDPLRPQSEIVVRPEREAKRAPASVLESEADAADPDAPQSTEASPAKPDAPAPTLPEAPDIVPDGLCDPVPSPLFPHGGGSLRPPQRVQAPSPERLEPLVRAVPFRPVEAADVAAAVEADMMVTEARSNLTYSLERVYRDPGRAAERLAALEQELGDAAAAAKHLAGRPTLLGQLRGSRWFFVADGAIDRHFALKSAGDIGPRLVALREAERRAASAYREPIERQRHIKAIEVPDLSRRAREAVEAVRVAGAAADWIESPPWDPRPPRAEEITNAARVAPIWDAIRADPALHGELTRFMHAVDRRLPRYRDQLCESSHSPERAAQLMSGILHTAEALHRCNPGFQAYAAEEPRRQAEAARAAARRQAEAERQALVAREVEAARLRIKEEAKAEAKRVAALAEQRRLQPRPSPGPRMG